MATAQSAPLSVSVTTPSQEPAKSKNEVTSYFEISTKRFGSPIARSPASPDNVSPGTQPRPPPLATARRPYIRFHSDYEALHRRIHNHTIEEDESRGMLTSPDSGPPPSAGTPSPRITPGRSFEHPPRRASLQSSESSEHSSLATLGPRASKESHTYPPRRPKISQIWGRSPSFTSKVENRNSTVDISQRRSSTLSESVVGGNVIIVRTDQTPLRPPQTRTVTAAEGSKISSIKVETEFTEVQRAKEAPQITVPPEPTSLPKVELSERTAREKSQSSIDRRRSSSRHSSINPRHIFSAPLQLLGRFSSSKHSNSVAVATPLPSPETRLARMPDHVTQLRRNYTAEALQRVTVALQEIKQVSSATLLPPQVVRPLTWKTFSDKALPQKPERGDKTARGIFLGTGNQHHSASPETQPSGVQSYTSSHRDRHLGSAPANTPDETATYKIKRSPSAETEEFLKVDISIRGGTSYLPSEARRIHTPPIPEEGADGQWKGFFFDYNAPRRTSSLQIPEVVVEAAPENGSASPESVSSPDLERSRLMPDGKPRLERSKTKNKRVLTSDWIDVKLAEIDSLGSGADPDAAAKEGCRRLNSPDVLSKRRNRIMYEGRWVEPDMFDLTIPDHLPSSPLCPRHPRYWRVVKGKGSQFRGCWMHGVGLYENTKA